MAAVGTDTRSARKAHAEKNRLYLRAQIMDCRYIKAEVVHLHVKNTTTTIKSPSDEYIIGFIFLIALLPHKQE